MRGMQWTRGARRVSRVSWVSRVRGTWATRWTGVAGRRDAGMVTSEYAMGIVAAVAFAVVLYKVVTSGTVSAELESIVKRALDARM
ncbi:DUF4244 domain-containing protein [Streptomyces sp. CRN 30]|uniref:DUF4244 domain-containing protein n=1 Tax=Streptomyces sp. CRN 30 TaxID=3075613 RepID=UPI0039C20360